MYDIKINSITERFLSVLTVLCLLIIPSNVEAQDGEVFTALQSVEQGRSNDREAYFFYDFEPGVIIGANGQVYNEAALNFNGFTKKIEVKRNNIVSELREGAYIKIIIRYEGLEYAFMRGMHAKFGMDIVAIPYDGRRIKLIAAFSSREDRDINSYDSSTKKINSQTDFYIISEGRISPISLNKKKVLAVLDTEKVDLLPYIEENNLRLKSVSEVVQLLGYYESQLL